MKIFIKPAEQYQQLTPESNEGYHIQGPDSFEKLKEAVVYAKRANTDLYIYDATLSRQVLLASLCHIFEYNQLWIEKILFDERALEIHEVSI